MTKPPRRPRRIGKILAYVGLILGALFTVWPVIIMGLEGYDIDLAPLFSGKAVQNIAGVPYYSGGIYPTPIIYQGALTLGKFPTLLGNTMVISAISIVMALAAGVIAGYTLARIPIRGKGVIAYMLLALRAVSPFAVVVPLYIVYTRNGLWNTFFGVGLAEELVILSIVVWMLRGFFADIPKEIYDAASIFGATEGQIFRRVALRMVIPGIVVTALFAFVLIWNEYVVASILTGPITKTVAVGVWGGLGDTSNSFKNVTFNELNAGGFLAWVPAIIVMLAIRRYLAKGYSLGTAATS
jgi:multiple sugar transport system permease protein